MKLPFSFLLRGRLKIAVRQWEVNVGEPCRVAACLRRGVCECAIFMCCEPSSWLADPGESQ